MNCILNYDFSQVNSTIIADNSGLGKAGVIRNFDKSDVTLSTESVYGSKASVLHLPGGRESGYIELPNGVLKDCEAFTFTMFFKFNSCTGRTTLFSIGNDKICAALLEPASEGVCCYAVATSGGLSQAAFTEQIPVKCGEWYCLTYSLDTVGNENRVSLYINGILRSSITQKRVACDDLCESTSNTIGFGPFSPEAAKLDISSISVLSHAISVDEASLIFNISDSDHVRFDTDSICFDDLLSDSGDFTVVKDLALPTDGTYGSKITWSSSDTSHISETGRVTRPKAGESLADILLTAVATYKDASLSKCFSFKVLPLPTDLETAVADIESIIIPDMKLISGDISLPVNGPGGCTVSWSSSNEAVVSSTGKVTRPSAGEKKVTVTLTASASLYKDFPEAATAKRTFELDIIPIQSRSLNTSALIASKLTEPLKDNATAKGHTFALSRVKLTGDSVFTRNRNRDLIYLKLLSCDRMLYNFRLTFGQSTQDATPLGGWDEPTGLLRGHSTGHFLSALALAFASTGDPEIRNKLTYLVNELYSLQKLSEGEAHNFTTKCTPSNAAQSLWSKDYRTWGKGFLSAYSPDQFALLELYTPYATIWAPYYTLHKLLAGFIDCYEYAGNDTALTVATGIADWVYDRLSHTTLEQRSKMWSMYIAGEYGGMNESLARLSSITGDERYLEAAKMFDNPKLFDGLSHNIDVISGLHANQHIPQIIGALAEYKASGDVKYYNIAKAFWDIVISGYTYSIGGVGRGEVFKESKLLAKNIDSDKNCETCAAYNMLKLTKELYSYDPDCAKYMDYYERTVLNQIAASQNPIVTQNRHNGVTYMLPIGPGAEREYSSDYDDFTCCHGTGMENHVKYQDSIFFECKDTDTIYVNLYMESTLSDDNGNPAISISPLYSDKTVDIIFEQDCDKTLKLRVPCWISSDFTVAFKGNEIGRSSTPSSYITIKQHFKLGDRLSLSIPQTLYLETTPDSLDGSLVASLCFGPNVMVALSDKTDWLELPLLPDLTECFNITWDLVNDYPTLDYFGLKFVPMYAAHNTRYHAYFKTRLIQ